MWKVTAFAAFAIATRPRVGTDSKAAIRRLESALGGEVGLVHAILALPHDALPYARLAEAERKTVRAVLTFFEAEDKLAALPPEPTFD